MSRPKGLSDRLLSGTAWTFAGSGAQMLIRLGTLVILARLISPTEFGYMAAVLTVVSISEALSNMGLAQALIQRKSIDRTDLVTAQTVAIILAVSFTALNWVFAAPIAGIFKLPEIQPYIRAASAVFLLHGLLTLAKARMSRNLDFKRAAKIETLGALIGYAGVVLPLAWMGLGVWALVAALIAQAAVSLGFYSRFYPPLRAFRIHGAAARRLLRFGMGSSGAVLANKVSGEMDYIIVGRLLGAEALGIYSRAFQLVIQQTKRAGQSFDRVLFPILATIQDDPDRLVTGYRRAMSGAFFASTLIGVVAWFLSEHAILLLLGSNWTAAVAPFAYLALAIGPRSADRINGSILKATGRIWTLAGLQTLNIVWVSIGAWIGAQFGIAAVALGVSIAFWVHFFVMSAVTLHFQSIPPRAFFRSLQPSVVGAGLMIAVLAAGQGLAQAAGLSFWITGGVLLAASAAGLLIVLSVPGIAMGPDGTWLRNFVFTKLKLKK